MSIDCDPAFSPSDVIDEETLNAHTEWAIGVRIGEIRLPKRSPRARDYADVFVSRLVRVTRAAEGEQSPEQIEAA